MSDAIEHRLRALLSPSVTDVGEDLLAGQPVTLLAAHEDEARALGIQFEGGPELTVGVTDRTRRLGQIRVQTGGSGNTIFIDNRDWGGNFYASIRMAGKDCFMMFNQIGDEYVSMPDIYLRSSGQFLFWGTGASAVGCSIELDGEGRGLIVGDDALVSDGVWIRNYDMHAIYDLASSERINRAPLDTVIERHVWLGQDALLLSCDRVGMGAIIGAKSLVKGRIPPRVAAAGTPARVLREGVSWGRHPYSMTDAERVSIGLTDWPAV